MIKISEEHGLIYRYCPEKKAYLSFNENGRQVGNFPEEYVVDPVDIWKQKSVMAGYSDEDGNIDFKDRRVLTLKPTETVFRIWEHYRFNKGIK